MSFSPLAFRVLWLFLVSAVLLKVFGVKPSFVLPVTHLNRYKKLAYITSKRFFLFLVVVYVFDLHYTSGYKSVSQRTHSIQILFDVSLSMTADDLKPTRFQASKEALQVLLQRLTGYKSSIIVFSAIPFIAAPRSDDQQALMEYVQQLQMGNFPPTLQFVGTALGDAILLGLQNLKSQQSNSNQKGLMIVLTDGNTNKGINPEQTVALAKKQGVPIFVLALGRDDYVIGKDQYGIEVTTPIDSGLLLRMAKETNGTYYRVEKTRDFEGIFEQISNLVLDQEGVEIIPVTTKLNDRIAVVLALFVLGFGTIELVGFLRADK